MYLPPRQYIPACPTNPPYLARPIRTANYQTQHPPQPYRYPIWQPTFHENRIRPTIPHPLTTGFNQIGSSSSSCEFMTPPSNGDYGRFSPIYPPGLSPPRKLQNDSAISPGRPLAQSSPALPHVNPRYLVTTNHNFGRITETILSKEDYELAVSKNKAVSSAAISRAVEDAAYGDFKSAIDTLQTAILILQLSKVSHDERVQLLSTSLQFTLKGIQGTNNCLTQKGQHESRSTSRYDCHTESRHNHRNHRSHSPNYRSSRSRSSNRESTHRSRNYQPYHKNSISNNDCYSRKRFDHYYDRREAQVVHKIDK